MKATIKIMMVMFVLTTGTIMAQQSEAIKPPLDKKKIELRPNSRDYGPVVRGNFHERQDRQRNKSMFMKVRPVRNGNMLKHKKNQGVNKEQVQRRRQLMMQRRMLRK
jgi:hypothetical protein